MRPTKAVIMVSLSYQSTFVEQVCVKLMYLVKTNQAMAICVCVCVRERERERERPWSLCLAGVIPIDLPLMTTQTCRDPRLPDEEILVVLVDVAAIRLIYDRNCSSDIVLPMGGLVVTRDKPYAVLDCTDTPMDTS